MEGSQTAARGIGERTSIASYDARSTVGAKPFGSGFHARDRIARTELYLQSLWALCWSVVWGLHAAVHLPALHRDCLFPFSRRRVRNNCPSLPWPTTTPHHTSFTQASSSGKHTHLGLPSEANRALPLGIAEWRMFSTLPGTRSGRMEATNGAALRESWNAASNRMGNRSDRRYHSQDLAAPAVGFMHGYWIGRGRAEKGTKTGWLTGASVPQSSMFFGTSIMPQSHHHSGYATVRTATSLFRPSRQATWTLSAVARRGSHGA